MKQDIWQLRQRLLEEEALHPTGYRAAEFVPIFIGLVALFLLILAGEVLDTPGFLVIPLQAVRLVLGLVFILLVPGYCLTAALFPANDFDNIERTGLSLGLSIAWIPVIALVLDRLPWGLRLWPIFIGQAVSILLFSVIALIRRARLPVGEVYLPSRIRPRKWWRSVPTAEKRIYLFCLGALLIASTATAWVFLVPSPDEFMTEFYILGSEGLAESYPREAAVDETLTVTMGINNLERQKHTYWVEVWAIDPWSGKKVMVNSAGPYHLIPEEAIETEIDWAMAWAEDDQVTEFYLFSTAAEEIKAPYRTLRLWLDVTE